VAASFPVTFPSAVTTVGTNTLDEAQHNDDLHVKDRDEIRATQMKLGLGSSVASGTTVLVGDGGTQSSWRQVQGSHVAAGAIGTREIASAGVATGNLATNAVTQRAAGSISAHTTTSTSYVTTTGGSISIVTTGTADIKAWANIDVQNASGNAVLAALKLDSANETNIQASIPGATGLGQITNHACFFGVSPGTHTILHRWRATGGTASIFSGGTLMVEATYR
jgi:hypothetical protein